MLPKKSDRQLYRVCAVSAGELDLLLAEQLAYYRARATEYDATSPVPADVLLRRRLVRALEAFAGAVGCLSSPVAPAVERPLRSGARCRTVKVFYRPDELQERLASPGWKADVQFVGWRFFYATCHRRKNN